MLMNSATGSSLGRHGMVDPVRRARSSLWLLPKINGSKTHILTKPEHADTARKVFQGSESPFQLREDAT